MRELIAVPNVSEGSDPTILDAIAAAFTAGGNARILDVHSDRDHGRTVFTLAGLPGRLAVALGRGAEAAAAAIDLTAHAGAHPHVGALDVAPVVFLDAVQRPAALAEALTAAAEIAARGLPVFLYGALAGGRTRAELRRGGVGELARRVAAGEAGGVLHLGSDMEPGCRSPSRDPRPLVPDFPAERVGPGIDPRRGAVLVAARAPLVAFNLELAAPATLGDAQAVAARIREGGPDGLPGLRAIGVELEARGGVAQVSMNVEDHLGLPLALVIEAVERLAPIAAAEIVGLAPAAAFARYPDGLTTRGRRTLEAALGA